VQNVLTLTRLFLSHPAYPSTTRHRAWWFM